MNLMLRGMAAPLVLALMMAGCTGGNGTKAPAGTPAPTPTAAQGTAAGGMYKGKVQRGYEISFAVSPNGKQVSKVKANVLESCTGSSSSRTVTFYMEGPFAVGGDGTLTAEEQDPQTKYTSKFTATLNKDGTASGTLIQKGVIAGTTCTTYELKWDATKQ